MFGFILAISSSFLSEISDIIGKKKMKAGEVSVYTTGFLVLVFGLIFFSLTAFVGGGFRFSILSLPTLIVRIVLEIILSYMTISALAKSNRSTFGFVRTLTIPLLLIADFIIGYNISSKQIFGIAIIVGVIISFIIFAGKFEKRGLGFLFFSSILPVATLSLYKYDISNFNSVSTEQIIVSSALLIFFLFMSIFKAKENPIKFLFKPIFFLQAVTVGIASVIGSFAYLFLLPSVVVAISRSGSVLFATLSGDLYFKEKRPFLKLFIALGIIVGLIFLI